MFLTNSRNFVQKRKMEITYDKREGFLINSLDKGYSGNTEMSFTRPVGLVHLVYPECRNTAAGYLAAAGGEWSRVSDSKSVSIIFVNL
jgi:hypothetical protein